MRYRPFVRWYVQWQNVEIEPRLFSKFTRPLLPTSFSKRPG